VSSSPVSSLFLFCGFIHFHYSLPNNYSEHITFYRVNYPSKDP
jgi:hypothetical protein